LALVAFSVVEQRADPPRPRKRLGRATAALPGVRWRCEQSKARRSIQRERLTPVTEPDNEP